MVKLSKNTKFFIFFVLLFFSLLKCGKDNYDYLMENDTTIVKGYVIKVNVSTSSKGGRTPSYDYQFKDKKGRFRSNNSRIFGKRGCSYSVGDSCWVMYVENDPGENRIICSNPK